ncbi:MAG: Hsp20/alpha crystallin family protein [Candidatus Promineifilaceae bacterium]|jgi:HSP20 family protein
MTDELQAQKQEAEISEGAERTRASRVYVPQVDIYSAGDNIIILADMPGVAEKDVDIMLDKDVLTINGYVSETSAPDGYDLVHGEYGIGDYQRTFTLPDEIDRDNIEATFSHGVLRMTLPKAPEAQARKISVSAA